MYSLNVEWTLQMYHLNSVVIRLGFPWKTDRGAQYWRVSYQSADVELSSSTRRISGSHQVEKFLTQIIWLGQFGFLHPNTTRPEHLVPVVAKTVPFASVKAATS